MFRNALQSMISQAMSIMPKCFHQIQSKSMESDSQCTYNLNTQIRLFSQRILISSRCKTKTIQRYRPYLSPKHTLAALGQNEADHLISTLKRMNTYTHIWSTWSHDIQTQNAQLDAQTINRDWTLSVSITLSLQSNDLRKFTLHVQLHKQFIVVL